jgi:hypothetical protein
MSKKEPIVIYLKLKSGEDILGFYGGEMEAEAGMDASIIMMRPLKIKQIVQRHPTGLPVFSYTADLYSLYGTSITCIPHSNVLTRDIASEFFSVYYQRTLGDLLVMEERIQESYVKMWDREDVRTAMGETDSMYMDVECEYKQ